MTEHDEQVDRTEQQELLSGLVAQFADQEGLVAAARRVREAGFKQWDCYSPYPIHGMERAMGMRYTRLPWLVLMCGIAGAGAALLMQWWMNAIDYPLNISGKPYFSLPANIPVTFELIVLFSAFAAFFGALAPYGLPRFHNPLFQLESFRRATTDRFFLVVEARDPDFDEARVRELFQEAAAISIEPVRDTATPAQIPLAVHLVGVVVLCLALIPPLWIARDRLVPSEVPRVHPVTDMDLQPKYRPQDASSLFEDGRTMRLPVSGTVARGGLRDDDHFYRGTVEGEFAPAFPEQLGALDMAFMQRGEERFNIYCATCHGLAGDGDGITSQRALAREDSPMWRPPLSLHSDAVREQPIGQIFDTITNGVDRENNGNLSMPAYASQIPPRDRWAIVMYVLALQRSRNVHVSDLSPAELESLRLRDQER